MLGNIIRKFLTETVSKAYGKNKHLYGKLEIETFAEEAVKELNQLLEYKEKCEELEKENLLTQYRLLQCFINKMPMTYRKRTANVWIVQEFLQYHTSKVGSTSSYEKCNLLGINPDGYEMVSYSEYKQQLEKES